MESIDLRQAIIQDISGFYSNSQQVSVLRLDLIHPIISGNKWFKLRYYLDEALAHGKTKLLTFGGAWSNHIVATAAAAALQGWSSTGLIRGEASSTPSPTLVTAASLGMEFIYIDRSRYRDHLVPAAADAGSGYLIPEGGSGPLGVDGASTIWELIPAGYDHICCVCGTGTMLAGLAKGAPDGVQVTGISVLKNNLSLDASVAALIPLRHNWDIIHSLHNGGYARYTAAQIQFMNELFTATHIPTDIVYTGKLFQAIHLLIQAGHFPKGKKILLIHSGGLQGNQSLKKGELVF